MNKKELRFILLFNFILLTFNFSPIFSAFEQRQILSRPSGLGGANVAEYGESSCIYYNPAGMINLPKYDFLFSYTKPYNIEVLTDMTASFATEIKSLGRVGFLWNSFGYELYKEDSLYVAYSNNLTSNFSTGINIKSNSVSIKNYGSKSLVGIDLGFVGVLSPSVVVGVMIKNINSAELSLTEKLPIETVTGFRLEYIANSPSYFDIIKPSLESIYFRLGQEIFFNNYLTFRLGIETVTKDKPAKYSFGFTISYKKLMFDYANVIHPYLGGQTLFSLRTRFGDKVSLGEIVFEEKVRSGTRRRRTSTKEYKGPKLDLNKATVEQLDELPGVGPSLAQKIVEVRKMLGGYKSVDDLEEVPRMGKITLERLKQYVYVGETVIQDKETRRLPKVETQKDKKVVPENVVDTEFAEAEEETNEKEVETPKVIEQPKVTNEKQSLLKDDAKKQKTVIVPSQESTVLSGPVEPSKGLEQQKVVESSKIQQDKPLVEEKKEEKFSQPQKEDTKQLVVEKKFNINKLSENELKLLGFSDTDAKNIVRYRTKFGNFKSVEELNKVPNINKKVIEKIKENLVIED